MDAARSLILLRHGESTWNQEGRFTGWTDVGLTERGEAQATAAARALLAQGYDVDLAFTSVLKRAIKTLWIVLEEMDRMWIPVHRSWRLNERHYGALQGLLKREVAARHGQAQVKQWRRGYAVRPPPLDPGDPRSDARDPRYAELPPERVPLTESLKDTLERVLPYWTETIAPEVARGRRVLIAAHGNSLRALVKHLDRLSDAEVVELDIPVGIPLVYELGAQLEPVRHFYLADPDEVQAAVRSVAEETR